jgi:hypothetical protein
MRKELQDERLAAKQESDVSDQASQATIKRMADGDLQLPSLSRSPRAIAMVNAAVALNPNLDQSTFPMRQDAQKKFGGGKLGDLTRQADVAIGHLDTADAKAGGWSPEVQQKVIAGLMTPEQADATATDHLTATNSPLFNAVGNWWKQNAEGKGVVRDFNTAKQLVSDEVNKFVVGGPGALEDRKALQAQLDAAAGPKDLREVTNTLREMMASQAKGLQSQYVNARLGSPEDFAARLSPRSQQLLLGGPAPLSTASPHIGGGGSALPGATGAAQPGTPAPTSGALPNAVPGPRGVAPAPIAPPAAPKRYIMGADGKITPVGP